MLYQVVRKDWASNFITPGTIFQPEVGAIFSGKRVNKVLCSTNPEGWESGQIGGCYERSVVMGVGGIPIGGNSGGVEFYFPTTHVRMMVGLGGFYVPVYLVGVFAAVGLLGYKLLTKK